MLVYELIQQLQDMPEDAEIVIEDSFGRSVEIERVSDEHYYKKNLEEVSLKVASYGGLIKTRFLIFPNK